MTFRVALVGLAVATLGLPAHATEAGPPPAGAAPAVTSEAGTSTLPRQGRRRRLASRNDILSALPPAKPAELGGASGTAASTAPSLFPLNPFAGFRSEPVVATPSVAAAPAAGEPSTNPFATLFGAAPAQPRGEALPPLTGRSQIDALISHHARLNGVPETLVHRIVVRESKYNPRAVGRGGAMGLMQIKTGTARALGYQGGPMGLLDAETNITYAVKYLAGAYRTAGGSHDLAVSHYARGYYYAAKRQGLVETASTSGGRRGSRRGAKQEADATPLVPAQPETPSLMSLFAARSASAAPAGDRAAR